MPGISENDEAFGQMISRKRNREDGISHQRRGDIQGPGRMGDLNTEGSKMRTELLGKDEWNRVIVCLQS